MLPGPPPPVPVAAPQPPSSADAQASETLFISIAAYCDPLLAFTLRSAFNQARHPGRLRFGVVEQVAPGQGLQLTDDWLPRQARWLQLPALQARGPCWARALAMTLYQGEDWFFQIDSHTWFEPGWDERLLHWAHHCRALNPRHLISCYPNPFTMTAGEPSAQVVGPQVLAHVVSEASQFADDHPVLMFEGVPVASELPVPGLHVGAGCLLAPGRVVQELPYDPRLYFHGEEQAFALRAWTRGWDIFHIPRMPVYHQYHASGQAPRPLHWSPDLDSQRAQRSAELTALANERLAALLWRGEDLGLYGLGRERSLADYADFSGIDYAGRRIAPSARKARFGL